MQMEGSQVWIPAQPHNLLEIDVDISMAILPFEWFKKVSYWQKVLHKYRLTA